MRITSVTIPEDLAKQVGLKPAKMDRLGRFVVLAGKNGSGKSRILNFVRKHAKDIATPRVDRVALGRERVVLIAETALLSPHGLQGLHPYAHVDLNGREQRLAEIEQLLAKPELITSDFEDQQIEVLNFVPRTTKLKDWADLSKDAWMDKAKLSNLQGVNHQADGAIPLIQRVMERWVTTTHPDLDFSESERTEAKTEYDRLQKIIFSFLGTEIAWDRDGYSTIFGKRLANALLSEGQQVLLQLCIAIYAQGGAPFGHVIFMDEPENHLHPSVVIDLLEAIEKKYPEAQIWIATHSVALLSHFDPSELWFVEDGQISHAGKKPEKVLGGLLGDETRIAKLREFTSLPADLARSRFAFECLCPPHVVVTDSYDPQSKQLFDQLQIIRKGKDTIRVLDYGAGKGRTIANLADYDEVARETLDYYAFDAHDSDRAVCLSNIGRVYDDAEKRYFNSLEELRCALDDECFDVVVLCNVLHEIPHTDWSSLFEHLSIALKPDGNLLLIEDCRIPVGELPHANGFLVLNTLHLKKLFSIPANAPGFVAHDARFDSADQRGRLMAHLIPRKYLKKVTAKTTFSALEELKKTAITEVKKSRAKQADYRNGLAHAFWIQQLANATLVLNELGFKGK